MSSTHGDETREDRERTDEGGSDTERSVDVVRAAKNEIRLREYNERIQAHHEWVGSAFPEWACECANKHCPEPVLLSIEEYEAIRAEPTHFLVSPSSEHVNPQIERVVQREERYWVLEKIGVGAAVAEAFDPRSP